MSLVYSPQTAQLSSSSKSMSMNSVHMRLELRESGEESSMGESNAPGREGGRDGGRDGEREAGRDGGRHRWLKDKVHLNGSKLCWRGRGGSHKTFSHFCVKRSLITVVLGLKILCCYMCMSGELRTCGKPMKRGIYDFRWNTLVIVITDFFPFLIITSILLHVGVPAAGA